MQTIDDHERWTSGYGLGLGLRRDGERVLAGHGGSMPGFIAGVLVSPRERVGAAVLTNSSTARIADLMPKLVTTTADPPSVVSRIGALSRSSRAAAMIALRTASELEPTICRVPPTTICGV